MTLAPVEAILNSKNVIGKSNKLKIIFFYFLFFIVHLKPIIIYEAFYNKNPQPKRDIRFYNKILNP